MPQNRLHLECVELGDRDRCHWGHWTELAQECVGWGGVGCTGTDLGPEDLSISSRMRSSTHNVKTKTGAPDDCRHSLSSGLEIASVGHALLAGCRDPATRCMLCGRRQGRSCGGRARVRPSGHNSRSHRYQGNAEQSLSHHNPSSPQQVWI